MSEATRAGAPAEPGPGGGLGGYFRNGRGRRLLVAAGIVALVVVAGIWYYLSGHVSTDDAQIDGHIVPIASRVGGTVAEVKVDDNQEVQAGAVLAVIDPRDYQTALQRAEADYADAQAALAAAQAGVPITSTTTSSQISSAGANVDRAKAGADAATRDVDASRARLESAQARLQEAQANSTRAARDFERMKQLIAKDEVSQQQYDAAVAAADAAKATVDAAKAAVNEAGQAVKVSESRRVQAANALTQAEADLRAANTGPEQVTVIKARAESAAARVLQAKAVLEQARLNLGYTVIKAPMTGLVSKKSVEPGQVIQAGQPLMAVVPTEDIWVTANFKETELKNMRPGQSVSVEVDAYGRTYRAHVDSLAAATGARFSLLPPENATGNYVKVVQRVPVKIVFEKGQDPKHLLRLGMSVVPTVYTR